MAFVVHVAQFVVASDFSNCTVLSLKENVILRIKVTSMIQFGRCRVKGVGRSNAAEHRQKFVAMVASARANELNK